MGIIQNNIFGAIRGSMGNLVFYQLNGKTVIRQKPGPRQKPASERQLYQQEAFRIGQKFVTPLREALNFTLKKKKGGFGSGVNRALSWVIRNAIVNENKKPILYPEKVKVTKGWLLGPENLMAERVSSFKIILNWSPNAWQGSGREEDRLFVIVYSPESKKVHTIYEGNYRKSGSQLVELPWTDPEIGKVYIYVSFYSQNGYVREFSDSVCLGTL
ncbi:DUF6266 family protein [Algoriphagus halophytocola]|uniref:DUF6266 family protein n=1 Tax=Algoriphagus halophytocola TaxID=2991499 RepID=A0ABY6MJF1_9BACT|nr:MULTISPECIES: DUF6266 family protein [unclassified Algoriphagus]UZD23915.1 DUF6266 family protein [Algoriphagus sp. TR-M5]WBL41283.1 DUF6266 family protein [Algoriphagus sp. TR-M9]